MTRRRTRTRTGLAIAALILAPGTAAAQNDASPVHLAVGPLGAAGFPGPIAAIRFGAIGARAGFDVDWGILSSDAGGDDRFVAGQLRILTRRRTEGGRSVSILIGANAREVVTRTEIRWPGGARTILEERNPGIAGQFGVGFDWLGRRSRIGLDLVTGVGERAGPRIFAKLFVVFGGTVQVE